MALDSLKNGYDGRFGEVDSECLVCHSAEAAIYPDRSFDLSEVQLGVTCAVCHQVHGDLDQPRLSCESCHDQGPFHHSQIAVAEHVPCPTSADVQCIDCHMPITIKIGDAYRLRSHAPGITAPKDASAFSAPSSCANGGCHQSADAGWLQDEYERFYGPTSLTAGVRANEAGSPVRRRGASPINANTAANAN